MKIAYLGPKATYCEQAAGIFAGGNKDFSLEQYPSIYDALNSLINNKANYAVVPIENSIEGSVNATLNVLYENPELKINGEMLLPIRHCLMAKAQTKRSEVDLILSHPQAVAQCNKYIKSKFSGVELRATLSTAEGAKQVADSPGNWAAIGNVEAARVYKLKVIEENIQDNENNVTRFVAISISDCKDITQENKTSIVFSCEDTPGSLYRILDIFNLWDINLTKIESRPARNQLGKYIFFVDIKGHKDDNDVREALVMVSRKTSFFRMLGSYPRLG
jgi:prephenate dehydratase